MSETERLTRNKQRASVKRDAAASQIEAVYNLGLSASSDSSDSSVVPKFLLAIKDIDEYWSKFTVENDSMLEAMIELGTDQEFAINVEIEVRSTLLSAKALANQLRISSGGSKGTSEVSQNDKPPLTDSGPNAESVTNPTAQLGPVIAQLAPVDSRIRLPEIPLPTFGGRLQNWPDFRDRFSMLVDQKTHLTNIEKFYYLLGCLQPGPTDVVKGITVSDATYNLAWSALVNRYDKPRQLATTLVTNMLNASVHHQESTNTLINFLNEFSKNIAMLKSLNVPDLGLFLLFAILVRCLPSTSRRLFEQNNMLKIIILLITSVNIRDMSGCLQPVRALIDPASQISIMTSDCAKRLGLHREKWTVPVAGLAGQLVQSINSH